MITLLAIDWASVGIKAGQLILSLSILVILHELGHFIPAKYFRCRVEKFYLFFDPWFSVFKKKIGETIYGIGWLPLGGYVKISGMVDESMDKEQLKLPPKPWEFRSKPAWQRLIIMIGGVTVNLILGFFLFAMILWVWGEQRLPLDKMKDGISVNPISESVGIRNGDRIVSIDNKPVKDYYTITKKIILDEGKSVQVNRNGQVLNLPIPKGTIRRLIKSKSQFVDPRIPTIVDTVISARFTENRLEEGDRVIAINDVPVPFYDDFRNERIKYKSQEIKLTVLRNADTVHVKANTDTASAIGFVVQADVEKVPGYYNEKYGFFNSIPAGVRKGWETLVMNIKNFKLLFTSDEVKASESLGSFLSIGNMFGAQWDWERFWTMTALLSIVLAFMNILPIPALDGGHVLFTLYEMITGRKPSDKFMEYAQMVGMFLLLALMAYALGLDFWRYLWK
ncbi:MAG TPA: RIP metalloprotease RseP [Flavitalea sp.]|nr:RIP metalloprotease RseP [Flavitalea sp.]